MEDAVVSLAERLTIGIGSGLFAGALAASRGWSGVSSVLASVFVTWQTSILLAILRAVQMEAFG